MEHNAGVVRSAGDGHTVEAHPGGCQTTGGRYARGRKSDETFKEFIQRIGKVELRDLLEDLARLRPIRQIVRFSRIGAIRANTAWRIMGVGECAGEVISPADFDLAGAEREVFEAQVALETASWSRPGNWPTTRCCMRPEGWSNWSIPTSPKIPSKIVGEFRSRFYDTQKFFDPFAGGKFAHYLFAAQEKSQQPYTRRLSALSYR